MFEQQLGWFIGHYLSLKITRLRLMLDILCRTTSPEDETDNFTVFPCSLAVELNRAKLFPLPFLNYFLQMHVLQAYNFSDSGGLKMNCKVEYRKRD